MNELPLSFLVISLVILILLSGFFSGSETGMMTINRYRLRHLARQNHRGALRVNKLLSRIDRLIGVILLGNNFVNILASAIATIIAIRFWGDAGVAAATIGLTLIILIFAEVTPKTLAAIHPERIVFPASLILQPLLKLLYPFVWFVNQITNSILKLFRINPTMISKDQLSREELRTLVHESGSMISNQHQSMLLSILDLEKASVNDIMIPRNEVSGIDITHNLSDIINQLKTCRHTRLPVYEKDLNGIIGILHIRRIARLLANDALSKDAILAEIKDPYFIPESTPLHKLLINFQTAKRRIGLVVDEYGDVIGLATLEDILEEIVGEFTTDMNSVIKPFDQQADGSYMVDGSTHIRTINRNLQWQLPIDGPKTLSGLIIEQLQTIPENSVCIRLKNYGIEVIQIKENKIQLARLFTIKNQ